MHSLLQDGKKEKNRLKKTGDALAAARRQGGRERRRSIWGDCASEGRETGSAQRR